MRPVTRGGADGGPAMRRRARGSARGAARQLGTSGWERAAGGRRCDRQPPHPPPPHKRRGPRAGAVSRRKRAARGKGAALWWWFVGWWQRRRPLGHTHACRRDRSRDGRAARFETELRKTAPRWVVTNCEQVAVPVVTQEGYKYGEFSSVVGLVADSTDKNTRDTRGNLKRKSGGRKVCGDTQA